MAKPRPLGAESTCCGDFVESRSVKTVSEFVRDVLRQGTRELGRHFPFQKFLMIFLHQLRELDRAVSGVEHEETRQQAHKKERRKTSQRYTFPTRKKPPG